jgi:hypothetical protein
MVKEDDLKDERIKQQKRDLKIPLLIFKKYGNLFQTTMG